MILAHEESGMAILPEKSHETLRPESKVSARVFQAAMGISLVVIGGLFVWLMARSYLRAKEMRSWPEVSCQILVSEIEQRRHDPQSPIEYRAVVNFGYEWLGKPQVGDHLTLRGSAWSSKQALAEQRIAEFPVGMTTRCRVNPAQPAVAVLKLDSLAPGYSIWFPGLFLVAGIGITIRAFRTKDEAASSMGK